MVDISNNTPRITNKDNYNKRKFWVTWLKYEYYRSIVFGQNECSVLFTVTQAPNSYVTIKRQIPHECIVYYMMYQICHAFLPRSDVIFGNWSSK